MSGEAHTPTVETLVEHAAFVRSVCRAMLRDEHLAEDAAQEAFAAALARGGGPLRRPAAWLGAVARNLSRRTVRARARREARELAVARRDGVPSAAENAARLETQRRVVAAVAALPEPARAVVILRYFDGVGPTEIARRLDLPVRTVESRLRRALATLRERLLAEAGPDRDRVRARLLLLAGATIMTTKTKLLAAAAAVLLLAGGALVLSPSSLPTTSPPPAAPEVASRTAVTPEAPDVTPPLPAPSPVDRARALPEAAGASTGALHGTIRYDDGVPVADAPVLLWGPGHLVAARTDSRGAYRFERVPFRGLGAGWTLRLGSKAATRMLGPVVVREGEDTEADFEISRVASLLISVRTPDGGPAGGVPVRLAPESGRTDTSAYGTTAPTGDLRFEWLAPRPYRVFVAASERWSAWSGRVDPEAWPENAPFLIELAASRALVVRVKNWPEGAEGPIQVSLTRLDGVGVPSWSTGKLDDRGMFTGTAPMPGEYRAFIRVAGQTCSLPRVVVPDHGPTEIDIDVPEGAVVEGRLLTAEGKPVPEATLWLRPATGGSGSPCGPTSEDGRFRILFVPTGDCILSARVGKLTYYALDPRTIEVGPAGVTGLDVRLPDRGTGSIAGRLVGFRSDGAAGRLRSLEVEREGPSGWRLYAMAGADGAEFRIDGLPAGRFRLEVPSMPIADLEESGATTVSLGEGEQKGGVEIHAETASQVVLALRRSDGRPFVDAVTPIATREGNHGRRMLILRPNAEGLCRVRLAPGTWRLACPGGPARMTVREIVVPERPGGPIEVVLW